ncbi:kinase-like domain-containing protein [Mycotypha africana]|uniref:kinase-like domain-containing protein n=1 Tax=Mycotypha africana TaxID=64632 RepID=UPI0022FFC9FB|nr:kinase-like domain-containing protein [Mycotypha africana]KAI8971426.1 kinase-like domain-containing protein [Mycotypha africana]
MTIGVLPPSPSSHHAQRQLSPPPIVMETTDATTSQTTESVKKINRYLLEKEIGHGTSGRVHLALHVDTHQHYAIKEFSKSCLRKREQIARMKRRRHSSSCCSNSNNRRSGTVVMPVRWAGPQKLQNTYTSCNNPFDLIRTEVAILKNLRHRNIITLYEVLDDPNNDSLYMVVMDMAQKGIIMHIDLHKTATPYTEKMARYYFRQVILGIEYLHFNGIVHKDIKPDNLLLSQEDVVKIVDFGVSEMFIQGGGDNITSTAGSPAFMPPELCNLVSPLGSVSGKAADIWSMGVTLYCLVHGHVPFASEGLLDLYEKIKQQPLIHLLEKLLEKDPTKRIRMRELRHHPWVTHDGKEPMIPEKENCASVLTSITEKDIHNAITKVRHIFTVVK